MILLGLFLNVKGLTIFLILKRVNLGETSSDPLHLPPSDVILHWLGCPEALATESGRAAEQLNHPYLNSNMAAHRLCMVHAAWGMSSHRSRGGRVLKTHQVRTCNIQGPYSLLMPLDIYDRYLWHIAPPRVHSGLDYRGSKMLYFI